MTRAKRVILSLEVKGDIEGYRQYLKHPTEDKHRCDERTIRRKVSAMKRTIKQRARLPMVLQDCEDEILGYEVNQDGTPKYPYFKKIIYDDPNSEAQWIFSVIYDASTKTSTIYRMRGSAGVHEISESTSHWILLKEFVNRNTTRNRTMKRLNITKEQFNRSRYFQKKYGTLEYVSESGKVYKTSKGKLIRFNESNEEYYWKVETTNDSPSPIPRCDDTIVSHEGYKSFGDCLKGLTQGIYNLLESNVNRIEDGDNRIDILIGNGGSDHYIFTINYGIKPKDKEG